MTQTIRLTYCSKATFTPAGNRGHIEPHVARILMQSRRNNPNKRIGGVLYYGNGHFFQCLEGDSFEVNQLTQKIMGDSRHRDVQILKVEQISERIFSNWSMKYVPVESTVKQFLDRHNYLSFNPYKFDDDAIEEIIGIFSHANPPLEQPDQHYSNQPGKSRGSWLTHIRQSLSRYAEGRRS